MLISNIILFDLMNNEGLSLTFHADLEAFFILRIYTISKTLFIDNAYKDVNQESFIVHQVKQNYITYQH